MDPTRTLGGVPSLPGEALGVPHVRPPCQIMEASCPEAAPAARARDRVEVGGQPACAHPGVAASPTAPAKGGWQARPAVGERAGEAPPRARADRQTCPEPVGERSPRAGREAEEGWRVMGGSLAAVLVPGSEAAGHRNPGLLSRQGLALVAVFLARRRGPHAWASGTLDAFAGALGPRSEAVPHRDLGSEVSQ
jgi:hypothetical protein